MATHIVKEGSKTHTIQVVPVMTLEEMRNLRTTTQSDAEYLAAAEQKAREAVEKVKG